MSHWMTWPKQGSILVQKLGFLIFPPGLKSGFQWLLQHGKDLSDQDCNLLWACVPMWRCRKILLATKHKIVSLRQSKFLPNFITSLEPVQACPDTRLEIKIGTSFTFFPGPVVFVLVKKPRKPLLFNDRLLGSSPSRSDIRMHAQTQIKTSHDIALRYKGLSEEVTEISSDQRKFRGRNFRVTDF